MEIVMEIQSKCSLELDGIYPNAGIYQTVKQHSHMSMACEWDFHTKCSSLSLLTFREVHSDITMYGEKQ